MADSLDSVSVATVAVEYIHAQFPCGEADWVAAADVQRMLVATEGDLSLARTKLCDAVKWQARTLDAWLKRDGPREMRVIARGIKQRPLIYSSAHHQRAGDILPAQWACCWHNAIVDSRDPFVQIDVVLDCYGFQPFLNLSLRPYMSLAPSLDSFFAERIHRLVLIDFPSIAQFLYTGMKPFVPQKTLEKVVFVNRASPESMRILDDLAVDKAMLEMMHELLRMNKLATNKTGREPSHTFTEEFVRRQHAKNEEQQSPNIQGGAFARPNTSC